MHENKTVMGCVLDGTKHFRLSPMGPQRQMMYKALLWCKWHIAEPKWRKYASGESIRPFNILTIYLLQVASPGAWRGETDKAMFVRKLILFLLKRALQKIRQPQPLMEAPLVMLMSRFRFCPHFRWAQYKDTAGCFHVIWLQVLHQFLCATGTH